MITVQLFVDSPWQRLLGYLNELPALENQHPCFANKVMRMASGDVPSMTGSATTLMLLDPDAAVLGVAFGCIDAKAWIKTVIPALVGNSRVASWVIEVYCLFGLGYFGHTEANLEERGRLIRLWFDRNVAGAQAACVASFIADPTSLDTALRTAVTFSLFRMNMAVPRLSLWGWLSDVLRKVPLLGPPNRKYADKFWRRYLCLEYGVCEWTFDCNIMGRIITDWLAFECYSCATYAFFCGQTALGARLITWLSVNFPRQVFRLKSIICGAQEPRPVRVVPMPSCDIWPPPMPNDQPSQSLAYCMVCRQVTRWGACALHHRLPHAFYNGFGTVAICTKRSALQHVVQGAVVVRDVVQTKKGSDFQCTPGRPSFAAYHYLDVGVYMDISIDVDTGEWTCARKKGKATDSCNATKLTTLYGVGKWLYFKGGCYFVCRCGLVALWRHASCRMSRCGPLCISCRHLEIP